MSSLRPPEYPRRQPSFSMSSTQLAMYIGLGALTVVFTGTLVAYFYTRLSAAEWRPPELPRFPAGLGVSTLLLVLVSVALHHGERRLQKNDRTGLARALLLALMVSVGFLLAQVQNWRSLALVLSTIEVRSLYAFCFYMLTVLHALHVLFGIAPLAHVYGKARRDEYSSSRSEGVRILRQYWDFLLVVWFVLLLALWI